MARSIQQITLEIDTLFRVVIEEDNNAYNATLWKWLGIDGYAPVDLNGNSNPTIQRATPQKAFADAAVIPMEEFDRIPLISNHIGTSLLSMEEIEEILGNILANKNKEA